MYRAKKNKTLILTIIILVQLLSTSEQQKQEPSERERTVYDILPEYGLPKGLLPNTVKSYSLSPSDDGRFVVVLEKPCYVQFEYLVYYETQIKGKLSYGSITELTGIQVKKLFLWFNVDEIRVDLPPPSNFIYFQVGIINKKLDIDQFETIHSCRDGVLLSCGDQFSNEPSLKLPILADEVEMITE